MDRNMLVASFAEAWIENIQVAGLQVFRDVASFAEAWIEKDRMITYRQDGELSPPSRRRGLKSSGLSRVFTIILSPPSRRRGLKRICSSQNLRVLCRLLRGGVD